MTGFRMPTRVHIAAGARRQIPELLLAAGRRRVLLVLDPGVSRCSWMAPLLDQLGTADLELVAFDRLHANPRLDNARDAASTAREHGCDAVLAVGGGSALDCGKAAAMLATNDVERILDYVGKDRYAQRPLPFLAVPTTCGTGSEVTWVSVLSDPTRGTKVSIKGESMFPDHAVVDPDVLATLPAALVASTSMDALTHALEATTCNQANPVSDALASEAVALIFGYLPRAYRDIEGDAEAREAVMRASTLAGLAFGNADVAAVHCLSESLGGIFDVPHGLANAILLEPVLRSHGAAIAPRLAALQQRVHPHDEPTAETFLDSLGRLAAAVEIPAFASLEIPTDRFAAVAAAAEANGSNDSNPRPMAAADYLELLRALGAA